MLYLMKSPEWQEKQSLHKVRGGMNSKRKEKKSKQYFTGVKHKTRHREEKQYFTVTP